MLDLIKLERKRKQHRGSRRNHRRPWMSESAVIGTSLMHILYIAFSFTIAN